MRRSEFERDVLVAAGAMPSLQKVSRVAADIAVRAGVTFEREPDALAGLRVTAGCDLRLGDGGQPGDAMLAEIVRRCEAVTKAVAYLEGADRFAKDDIIMNLRALLEPRP